MMYEEEAKEALVEYNLKGIVLKVEPKYASQVREVTYNDTALLITTEGNNFAYSYKDTKSVIKRLFNEFVDRYDKIKAGGEAERKEYSLGRLFNKLNQMYPKKK